MIVSVEEKQQGLLSSEKLELACQTLAEVGYVVFERILPVSLIEEVREAFEADSQPEQQTVDFLTHPFLDPGIIDNPIAVQIIEAVMGSGFFSSLPYGFNSTRRDSRYYNNALKQWIHRDSGHLFPQLGLALPVTKIVVNIPLIDFTLENGCTEIWPGSHLIVDPIITPSTEEEELFKNYHVCSEERAAKLPSERMVMPAGSVVVRDMRCWHRAMPNCTDQVRTMIAMVYFSRFHNALGDHGIFRTQVANRVWQQIPERAQQIYRFHPID